MKGMIMIIPEADRAGAMFLPSQLLKTSFWANAHLPATTEYATAAMNAQAYNAARMPIAGQMLHATAVQATATATAHFQTAVK